MAFWDNIRFPYFNMQELNLDWMLEILKHMSAEMEEIRKIVEQADIDDIVRQALLELIDTGKLPGLNAKFNQTKDDYEEYKNATLAVIASWLVNELDSTSIVSPGAIVGRTLPFYARYNDTGKAYTTLLEDYGTDDFTYSDTHDGEPVIYMMCAGMLQLVLRGREFNNSPCYEALQSPYDHQNVLKKCWEAGSTNDKNWTIDCLNNTFTWKMANVLDDSGCTLQLLHAKTDADGVYADLLSDMRTGDILFFGDPSAYPARYKGISHCAYYIKEIADLDAAGVPYNAKFKPVTFGDHMNTDNGLIFHCSSGVGGDYTDVLRLETLDHVASVSPRDIWVCRPSSNSLNSNKALRKISGLFRAGDLLYYGVSSTASADTNPVYRGAIDVNRPAFMISSLDLKGLQMGSDISDMNALNNGVFFVNNYTSIVNTPSSATDDNVLIFQFGDFYKWQFTLSPNEGRIRYRQMFADNTWGGWKNLSFTMA